MFLVFCFTKFMDKNDENCVQSEIKLEKGKNWNMKNNKTKCLFLPRWQLKMFFLYNFWSGFIILLYDITINVWKNCHTGQISKFYIYEELWDEV